MSWMAVKNGTEVWARFAKEEEGDNAPTDAEITVRKSVFAPHMRGLGNITVRGFVFEHAGTPILAYFILLLSRQPSVKLTTCTLRGPSMW